MAHIQSRGLGATPFDIEARIHDQETSKGARIRDLIQATQAKFKQVSDVISTVQNVAAPMDVSNAVVAGILSPMRNMVTILDHIGELHPYLTVVAGVAKIVIQMELGRRENDKQIVVVYFAMNSLLLVLADLNPSLMPSSKPMPKSLEHCVDSILDSIKGFGNFCEVYYRQPSFVRSLKSKGYKDILAGFVTDFGNHRSNLTLVVSSTNFGGIGDIATDIKAILALLTVRTHMERSTDRLLSSMGGLDAISQDDRKLEALAKRTGETLDANAKRVICADCNEVLKANLDAFQDKLRLAVEHMWEPLSPGDVDHPKTLTHGAHGDGPSRNIEDPDIKAVWEEMQARTSVKTRIFFDAVYNYFESLFTDRSQRPGDQEHPDAWTLHFLSKAYFRPAIADAIDEETSEYITPAQINRFLHSRPREMNCSNITWVAFWAVGPYKTDIEYLHKIRILRARLLHSPEKVLFANKRRVTHLAGILPLLKLIEVDDDVLPSVGEVEAEHKEYAPLEKLRQVWRDQEYKRIVHNLETLKYQLKGPDYVSLVLEGHQLENRIMPLIYALLRHDMDIVKLATTRPVAVREFEDMRESWSHVFNVFGRRLGVLSEVWRQQRLSVESHVQYYRRGLFRGWYERNRAKAQISSITYTVESDDIYYHAAGYAEDLSFQLGDRASMPLTPRPGLLRYPEPSEPEDESGLSESIQTDWEPLSVKKHKANIALMAKVEEILMTGRDAKSGIDYLMRHQTVDPSAVHKPPPCLVTDPEDPSLNRGLGQMLGPDIHLQEATAALQTAAESMLNPSDQDTIIDYILLVPARIAEDLTSLVQTNSLLEVFVNLFKAVIALQDERDSHDLKIAVAYMVMFDAVYQFYALENIFWPDNYNFYDHLSALLGEFGGTVNEFGSACETYYTLLDNGQTDAARTYAVDEFPAYVNQFANHKQILRELLKPHCELDQLTFSMDVDLAMRFFR